MSDLQSLLSTSFAETSLLHVLSILVVSNVCVGILDKVQFLANELSIPNDLMHL
jgi:hypothetical protein